MVDSLNVVYKDKYTAGKDQEHGDNAKGTNAIETKEDICQEERLSLIDGCHRAITYMHVEEALLMLCVDSLSKRKMKVEQRNMVPVERV